MEWTQLFTIALGAILVNNFIVAQFLASAPSWVFPKRSRLPPAWGWRLSSSWAWLRHLLAHQ